MPKYSCFYHQGTFYKGNLHCHSTLSDGTLSPPELKSAYASKGYDFLLMSDHNIHTHFTELDDDHFIFLRGFEGNMIVPEDMVPRKEFHLIFLKAPDRNIHEKKLYPHMEKVSPELYTGNASLYQYVEKQCRRGYMAIFCHPYWSFNDEHDIAGLDQIIGMEVLNYCSHITENTGFSELVYDQLLRKGKRFFAFATDDNHNKYPLDSPGCDSFGGYIVVKAKSLDEESILEAIYDGSFYSSMGPEIYDFYIDGNEYVLTCSPASRVFVSDQTRNYRVTFAGEEPVTQVRGKLLGNELYIRAEVIDVHEKKAYTNPLFLNNK